MRVSTLPSGIGGRGAAVRRGPSPVVTDHDRRVSEPLVKKEETRLRVADRDPGAAARRKVAIPCQLRAVAWLPEVLAGTGVTSESWDAAARHTAHAVPRGAPDSETRLSVSPLAPSPARTLRPVRSNIGHTPERLPRAYRQQPRAAGFDAGAVQPINYDSRGKSVRFSRSARPPRAGRPGTRGRIRSQPNTEGFSCRSSSKI